MTMESQMRTKSQQRSDYLLGKLKQKIHIYGIVYFMLPWGAISIYYWPFEDHEIGIVYSGTIFRMFFFGRAPMG